MSELAGFDLSKEVLIVAEIGNNHEGNFDVARELIGKAAETGVHAVKFQTYRTASFVRPRDKGRFDRLKKFELSFEQFAELRGLAVSLGLKFIATPLDLESARFLATIVDCYKVASGDNDFYPLLEVLCGTGKPIIVSTGLSDLDQIHRTKNFIDQRWSTLKIKPSIALLHCVSSYPVPAEDANLQAIPFLAEAFACAVGYSDHTLGTHAAVAAAALGATIIEKHFTLDKNFSDFRDHHISADPAEMRELVKSVTEVRRMLGSRKKIVQQSELASRQLIRRSISAAYDLPAGHRLQLSDLAWTRPADGVVPGEEHRILGKKLMRAIPFGDPILESDVE